VKNGRFVPNPKRVLSTFQSAPERIQSAPSKILKNQRFTENDEKSVVKSKARPDLWEKRRSESIQSALLII
jgi:hypothetical protein